MAELEPLKAKVAEACAHDARTPFPCVLVSFNCEGGGAYASMAKVMLRSEWDALSTAITNAPEREIANEWVGGRTSDVWMTSHELVQMAKVDDNPAAVAGFLTAYPSGFFGNSYLDRVLKTLVEG